MSMLGSGILIHTLELTLSRAAIIIAFIPRGQGFDARDIRAGTFGAVRQQNVAPQV